MRHRLVVNVPKASKHVPYGYEMRSYFTHRPDRLLVGYDAAGLELRMLAHFMDDEAYSKAVLEGKESEGTDVHTLNQRMAGLLHEMMVRHSSMPLTMGQVMPS